MIGQTDADVRILAAVLRKHLQQTAAQRKAAGRAMWTMPLCRLWSEKISSSAASMLSNATAMCAYSFSPSGVRRHTLRRAEEQRAAQLGFKTADDARDVRLIVVERGSGLRKALVLCGIVENTVAVIADIRGVLLLSRWRIYIPYIEDV